MKIVPQHPFWEIFTHDYKSTQLENWSLFQLFQTIERSGIHPWKVQGGSIASRHLLYGLLLLESRFRYSNSVMFSLSYEGRYRENYRLLDMPVMNAKDQCAIVASRRSLLRSLLIGYRSCRATENDSPLCRPLCCKSPRLLDGKVSFFEAVLWKQEHSIPIDKSTQSASMANV